MNKLLVAAIALSLSINVLGSEKSIPKKTDYVDPLRAKFEASKPKPPMKGKFKPSEFDVIPLNSPVKGKLANFLLKLPPGFEVEDVKYRVQNASHILLKEKNYSPITLAETPVGKKLHIPLKDTTPGFYRLYVKVKPKDGSEERQYQTAYLDFVRFIVAENPNGVPMPDPTKNKATVGGIDSDRNGIRDDIQIWINEEFKDRPLVKLAMKQFAQARQLEILNTDIRMQSIEFSKQGLDAQECLDVVTKRTGIYLIKLHDEKLLNTKDRLSANIKSNSNFSGQSYSLAKDEELSRSMCNF